MSNQTRFCAALITSVACLGFAASGQAGDQVSDQTSNTAQAPALPFTYETFEAAVPHIDLENCPPALPQVDSFCRASIRNEDIHVFAFSLQGDSPMVGFASFSAEGLETLLK